MGKTIRNKIAGLLAAVSTCGFLMNGVSKVSAFEFTEVPFTDALGFGDRKKFPVVGDLWTSHKSYKFKKITPEGVENFKKFVADRFNEEGWHLGYARLFDDKNIILTKGQDGWEPFGDETHRDVFYMCSNDELDSVLKVLENARNAAQPPVNVNSDTQSAAQPPVNVNSNTQSAAQPPVNVNSDTQRADIPNHASAREMLSREVLSSNDVKAEARDSSFKYMVGASASVGTVGLLGALMSLGVFSF